MFKLNYMLEDIKNIKYLYIKISALRRRYMAFVFMEYGVGRKNFWDLKMGSKFEKNGKHLSKTYTDKIAGTKDTSRILCHILRNKKPECISRWFSKYQTVRLVDLPQ